MSYSHYTPTSGEYLERRTHQKIQQRLIRELGLLYNSLLHSLLYLKAVAKPYLVNALL